MCVGLYMHICFLPSLSKLSSVSRQSSLRSLYNSTWRYIASIILTKTIFLKFIKRYFPVITLHNTIKSYKFFEMSLTKNKKIGVTGICMFVFGILFQTAILPAVLRMQVKRVCSQNSFS